MTADSRPSAATIHSVWVAAVVYLLIALAFFYPLILHIDSRVLADDIFLRVGDSDAYNFLWSYWWVQKAVTQLRSPLYCDAVLPPVGADLLYHTHLIIPSIITIPLGVAFGSVAGYNCMILGLLIGGALTFHGFLLYTMRFSRLTSVIGGFLFGFMPYFIFKAHAHPNLINSALWGGCIAILWDSYLHQRFRWRRAFLWSALFWATFWTSFVEAFMLGVAVALSVIVLEAMLFARPYDILGRIRFIVAFVSLGVLAAVPVFAHGFEPQVMDAGLFPSLPATGLLMPPRLHFLSMIWHAGSPEFWGISLPLSAGLLAIVGVACGLTTTDRRTCRRSLIGMLIVAVMLLLLTLGGWFGSQLRHLTSVGNGFRVYARFFPFAMFFFCTFAALGIESAVKRGAIFRLAIAGVVALAVFEYYPFLLKPSSVITSRIPRAVIRAIDDQRFLLYLPKTPIGLKRNDTFQVSVDRPVVQLSYLARESQSSKQLRTGAFPRTYGGPQIDLTPQWRAEARQLNIGYIYLEDRSKLQSLTFPYNIVYEDSSGVLLKLL